MEAEIGARVPELRGIDLGGKPVALEYGEDQRKVLLFVFSPTCGFCDQNWPKWWALKQALDREAVRPVAVDVTSSSTATFLADHRWNDIPVIFEVDPVAVPASVTSMVLPLASAGRTPLEPNRQ